MLVKLFLKAHGVYYLIISFSMNRLNEYVDDESTSSAFLPLSKIVNTLKTIRSDVSKCMHLRQTSEYQLAYYPASHGNARYERHRDAFPTDDLEDEDQRRVTAICYLNPPDWNASTDGGQLRLHRPQLADIMMDPIVAPLSGRIVLFLSGVIDHEVMSSKRDRFAVTSWIK